MVYVLRSLKNGKRYVGLTGQTIERRLRQHHSRTNRWTRQNGPFELIYYEPLSDKKSALAREKYLKTGAGRKFLAEIIPL